LIRASNWLTGTRFSRRRPLDALRRAVRRELERRDRQEVLAELEELRVEPQQEDDPDAEDVVLEVLDFATGWCRPDRRI
jgi:predicted RNA polymerase sigma factor